MDEFVVMAGLAVPLYFFFIESVFSFRIGEQGYANAEAFGSLSGEFFFRSFVFVLSFDVRNIVPWQVLGTARICLSIFQKDDRRIILLYFGDFLVRGVLSAGTRREMKFLISIIDEI